MKNDNIFIHDGWQAVMSLKNGKVENRYLWGAKQDELLCRNDEWTLGDHLNTVRDVVKSDGSVAKHLEYNAFGECLSVNTSFPRRRESSQNDNELAFLYTGKLFDAKTGLQWNINRWYDPKVGMWCSEDPIGFRGKDENLYRYVRNNSNTGVDLHGFEKAILAPENPCNDNSPCLNKCRDTWGGATPGLNRCIDDCNTTKDNFEQWYEFNQDITWTKDLTPCPCEITKNTQGKWNAIPGFDSPSRWPIICGYHQGAHTCIRGKSNKEGHASQCCYAIEDNVGKLITEGSGQGSGDKGKAGIWGGSMGRHRFDDMIPSKWALDLDGGSWGCYSEAYLNVRPLITDPENPCPKQDTPKKK